MDLIEAFVTDDALSVNDLIDNHGILVSQNAIIERIRDPIKVPSQITSLNASKLLFNYKLNRKKIEESESEASLDSESEDSILDEESGESEEEEEEVIEEEED